MAAWNYNSHVEDYLMANQSLKSVAIISHQGMIWAQSEAFPIVGEIASIMLEFQRPGTLRVLILGGGTRYNIVQGIEGSVIRVRLKVRNLINTYFSHAGSRTGGITIMKTRNALVIGIYDRSPDHCSTIVESLGNHFIKHHV